MQDPDSVLSDDDMLENGVDEEHDNQADDSVGQATLFLDSDPVVSFNNSDDADCPLLHDFDILESNEYVDPGDDCLGSAFVAPSTLPGSALTELEAILDSVKEQLREGDDCLCISLRRAPRHGRSLSSARNSYRTVTFPGQTNQEAWSFTCLIRVIALVRLALIHGSPSTKRDIFYKDPLLFKNQGVVDRLVDDIARTLSIHRTDLNVTSTAKGLWAGAMIIERDGRLLVDCSLDQDGSLIPSLLPEDRVHTTALQWILIIEKEAVFRAVLASELWPIIASQGLIITAKGYPDRLSRLVLKSVYSCHLLDLSKDIPIFALVDYDPDGLGILHTYKYGSANLAHEGPILDMPCIRWIGMRSASLQQLSLDTHEQALLPLSSRDHRKAISMLNWKRLAEDVGETELRHEIQILLMLNVKVEIECLEYIPGGIARYLTHVMLHDAQGAGAQLI